MKDNKKTRLSQAEIKLKRDRLRKVKKQQALKKPIIKAKISRRPSKLPHGKNTYEIRKLKDSSCSKQIGLFSRNGKAGEAPCPKALPERKKEAFKFTGHDSGIESSIRFLGGHVSGIRWRLNDWRNIQREQACESWADWLKDDRWNWQHFVSITFKKDIHPEQANKYFKRWIKKINQGIYGERFRRHGHGITWVMGLEYQRRGVIHFHALFSGLPDWWDRYWAAVVWESLAENCGWIRIKPYRVGAPRYVSKYISKGGELDVFVGGKKSEIDRISQITSPKKN